MHGRLAATILLLFSLTTLRAQVSGNGKVRFHSINNVGTLFGAEKRAFQFQTIDGLRYKNWFAGPGLGLEYYSLRTVPLFFDVRHWFGKGSNRWFVYGDAGNIITGAIKAKKKDFVESDKFRGKGYFDLGAGYQLALGKRHSLLISAGYSRLNLRETRVPIYFTYHFDDLPNTFTVNPPQHFNYHLDRVTVKLGFSF